MPKQVEVKILSIESLHVTAKVNKKSFQKAQRFARTLIDEKGKTTRQINVGEGWNDIVEEQFYFKVEETRKALITKLKTELLANVKKAQPKVKKEK